MESKRKLKILVFSWRDPRHPNAGGAEQVMHEHMKGWIRRGHEVTLFSSYIRGQKREETIDGVRIVRRGWQYFGVQIMGFLYYLENKNKFDLLVDQFHGLPFFTPLYVKQPILAVVQEVAGKVWLKNDLPVPLNWVIGIIGYLGEPFLFWFYRNVRFLTGSPSTRSSLIKLGIPTANIVIIPHGVLVWRPKPMPQKERIKTLIFLGAVSKDKGIDSALEVFGLLNKEDKYRFWVVGRASDYYKKFMKLKAKSLGLEGKLTYFGYLDDHKKFELLARAHLMVNPSVLEGWGLVNIEANSVGTPVVAYNSPGLVDAIKNNVTGVICKKNNQYQMAMEIRRLLRDTRRYRKMQKAAEKWSSQFTWSRARRQSVELIESLWRKR